MKIIPARSRPRPLTPVIIALLFMPLGMLMLIPVASATIPSIPIVTAMSPVGGQVQLDWPTTHAAYYKVYESSTSATWPGDFDYVETVTPAYNSSAVVLDSSAGTKSNNVLAVSTGIVQSIVADASRPLLTQLRFNLSFTSSSCSNYLNVTVATADYTLAGTTWNAAKEVGGIKTAFHFAGGSAASNTTSYPFTVDFQSGRIWIVGGINQPQGGGGGLLDAGGGNRQNFSYTGVGGVTSGTPVVPNVGANGAYVKVQTGCSGAVMAMDTGDPIAGGNLHLVAANGVYGSIAASDFWHFMLTRATPGYTNTAMGTALGCSNGCSKPLSMPLNESSTYYYRVVAGNSDGDALPSEAASVTISVRGDIDPYDPSMTDLWGQLGTSSSGSSTANAGNYGSAITGGTYFAIVGGIDGGNTCSGTTAMTWTNMFSIVDQRFVASGGLPYTSPHENPAYVTGVADGISYVTILQHAVPTDGMDDRIEVIVKFIVEDNYNLVPGSTTFSKSNPDGGAGCPFGATPQGTQYGPSGTLSATQTYGDAFINFHALHYRGGTTSTLRADALIIKPSGRLTEIGAIVGQTDFFPISTEITFTQSLDYLAGSSTPLFGGTAAGSTANTREWVQSFAANPVRGRFLSEFSFGVTGIASCSGTASMSVASTLDFPWNVTNETANITFDYAQGTTSRSGTMYAYFTGTSSNTYVASTAPATSISNVRLYQFGAQVFNANTLAPLVDDISHSYYFHFYQSSATYNCLTPTPTASDAYAGQAYYNNTGAGWTPAVGDLGGATAYVYGGDVYEWKLNLTPSNVGGALYVITRELTYDTQPGLSHIVSSIGGADIISSQLDLGAGVGSPECGGYPNACNIVLRRVGYIPSPWTSTSTITFTFDRTASGRNLFFAGLLVNQPSSPQVGALTLDYSYGPSLDMNGILLYSTDDSFKSLNVTVRECLNDACTSLGDTQASITAINDINGDRTVVNLTDGNGGYVLTGQDILSADIDVSLSASGWATTAWTIHTTSFGGYEDITLGIFPASGFGGSSVELQTIVITWSGNFTRVEPDTLNITANRSRNALLYVDCVKVDSTVGSARSICSVDEWAATEDDSYNFKYPQSLRNSTSSQDTGTYVVFIMNATGAWVSDHAFCFNATWNLAWPGACTATVGSDLQVQLATDSLNELGAVQRALADAQAIVSETSVRQHYLDMLDWGLAPFADCSGTVVAGASEDPACKIPNVAWWYLCTLVVAAVGVSRGRRSA
jgi:hypothetical protein